MKVTGASGSVQYKSPGAAELWRPVKGEDTAFDFALPGERGHGLSLGVFGVHKPAKPKLDTAEV